MKLNRAKKYLNNVLRHQEIVPFRKYNFACGRKAQAKQWGTNQGKWPVKSVYAMLKLLRNCEANAKVKNLKDKELYISHLTVMEAPKIRRRTFRAHGRINSYMSCPCHIHVTLSEESATTKKPEENKN
jgi:large subunit ribosomal protein L17e